MSGGVLDYAFIEIDTIVEQIEKIMEEFPNDSEEYSEEYSALQLLLVKLGECINGLYRAEWWLSGDTDSKQLLEWAKQHEV
jgi:hypothetical protein